MKLNKGAFLASLIMTGGGILVALLATTILRDQIVIRFGVRTLRSVQAYGIGAALGGATMAGLAMIPNIRNRKRQSQQQRQEQVHRNKQVQIRTKYAEDSSNPDLTRQRLLQAQNEMPAFAELFARCLVQMDRMDALQLKQSRLISDNEASYLGETENVLNKVEGRICQNFRNIINLCIVADGIDQLDTDKVEKILNGNEEKLVAAKSLLQASVEWVNQYNADNNNDRSEVEKWISVIRDYLKEE